MLNKALLAIATLLGVWLVLSIVGGISSQVGQVTGLPTGDVMSGTSIFLFIVAMFVFGKGWLDKRGQPSAGAQFAYTSTVAILFISAVLVFFFGERWLMDPMIEKRFDVRTKVPQYMVYEVEGGVKLGYEDRGFFFPPRLLHPDDCRPEVETVVDGETKKVKAPHWYDEDKMATFAEWYKSEEFDYPKNGTCFSEATRKPLRPIAGDDAIVDSMLGKLVSWIVSFFEEGSDSFSWSEASCKEHDSDRVNMKRGMAEDICVEGKGWSYHYFFGTGIGQHVDVEFADRPVRVYRQFDTFPEEVSELFTITYYGDGSPNNCATSTDTVCIRPNPQAFQKYHLKGVPVWLKLVVR